jgi:carbonic anhydrase
MAAMLRESETLAKLVHERRIAIVGAMYDVANGHIEFLTTGDSSCSTA